MSTEKIFDERTAYCVPIDEIDDSIEETATLEIPLEGKYSPNKATNAMIRTTLNMVTVLGIIIVSVIVFPILHQALIVDLVTKAKSLQSGKTNKLWYEVKYEDQGYTKTDKNLVQIMLDSIRSSDLFLFVFLFVSSVIMLITGISYNYIQSTVTSIFIFIFAIIWFAVVMMKPNATFVKDNFDVDEGKLESGLHEKPSFDQSNITIMSIAKTILVNNFEYIKEGDGFLNKYGYALGAFLLYSSMILILVFLFGVKNEVIASYSFLFLPISIYIAIFLKFVMNS